MVIEIIGWVGTVLLILAYLLAARGRLPASSWQSAAVNATAAGCLVVNSLHHGAMPLVALNTTWGLIGLVTLLRHRRGAGDGDLDPAG